MSVRRHHSWARGRERGEQIPGDHCSRVNPKKQQHKDENAGGGRLHSKYFNHYSERRTGADYSPTPHVEEIELKNRISYVTEMIFRCLLRGQRSGKEKEKKPPLVCFLETWRSCDYSEEKTHIGGCVLSSPRRRDEKRSLSTSAWRRAPLHAPLRLRLEMLISQTKTPLIHICNETMKRRGVSCVAASECGLMCADTMFLTLDGARRMNRVYCNLQHKGGWIMRRAMLTAL